MRPDNTGRTTEVPLSLAVPPRPLLRAPNGRRRLGDGAWIEQVFPTNAAIAGEGGAALLEGGETAIRPAALLSRIFRTPRVFDGRCAAARASGERRKNEEVSDSHVAFLKPKMPGASACRARESAARRLARPGYFLTGTTLTGFAASSSPDNSASAVSKSFASRKLR
jgi:hypothetical protein